jgi:hypothetical protein
MRVHVSFAKKRREQFPVDTIRDVVARLDLTEPERPRATPRLRIHRLRFTARRRSRTARGCRSPTTRHSPPA